MIFRYNTAIKYLLSVILAIFSFCPAYSMPETVIDEELDGNEQEIIELEAPKKDLQDVIEEKHDIDNDKINPQKKKRQSLLNLFREQGYQFEKGPIKSQRISFYTHGGVLMEAQRDKDFSSRMQHATNELSLSTIFANEKTRLEIAYNFTKTRDFNDTIWGKFSYFEVMHTFNEHQMLEIGGLRVPNGYEGGSPSSQLHFLNRSQIARTYGNGSAFGVRNRGDYKYLFYDVSFTDGSRFWQEMLGGAEITALASIKPLGKFGDKYGTLKIGGSIDHGRSHDQDFSVVGGHIMYKYKKFYWDTEYQYANNYAGGWYGRGKSHGLYTNIGYFVTPKIELLARYDFFQKLSNHNITTEYTAGLNYYITPTAKVMLNYILATDDKHSAPKHKIYLGVDFKYYSLLDKVIENL